MTSVKTTTQAEWDASRLSSPAAPWADLETDQFFMQVPRNSIYQYTYAEVLELLQNYNQAMDGMNELSGYPNEKVFQHVLYIQPDYEIANSAFGVGYPQVNTLAFYNDPASNGLSEGPGLGDFGEATEGRSLFWMTANATGWDTTWHEIGHCQLQTMYRGETECSNNVFYAYIHNVKLGADLDTAMAYSLDTGYYTIDGAAIHWMITENFRNGKEMDHDDSVLNEFRYQHRGWAKYLDIARLFGWQALRSFYYEENLDAEMARTPPGSELDAVDSRTLRLSIQAGVDLTPLIRKLCVVVQYSSPALTVV
jgi:hypothetical protein